MQAIEFILYVKDIEQSKLFYIQTLQREPSLNLPEMVEFELVENVKLGLMPEQGIAKIIGNKLEKLSKAWGVPHCELYLKIKGIEAYQKRALLAGAKEISPIQNRDWGDRVGYVSDLDGHILAFAETII